MPDWHDAGLMVSQRRRRWANISPATRQCGMLAGTVLIRFHTSIGIHEKKESINVIKANLPSSELIEIFNGWVVRISGMFLSPSQRGQITLWMRLTEKHIELWCDSIDCTEKNKTTYIYNAHERVSLCDALEHALKKVKYECTQSTKMQP